MQARGSGRRLHGESGLQRVRPGSVRVACVCVRGGPSRAVSNGPPRRLPLLTAAIIVVAASKRVTISTSGVVPRIANVASELGVNLAVRCAASRAVHRVPASVVRQPRDRVRPCPTPPRPALPPSQPACAKQRPARPHHGHHQPPVPAAAAAASVPRVHQNTWASGWPWAARPRVGAVQSVWLCCLACTGGRREWRRASQERADGAGGLEACNVRGTSRLYAALPFTPPRCRGGHERVRAQRPSSGASRTSSHAGSTPCCRVSTTNRSTHSS